MINVYGNNIIAIEPLSENKVELLTQVQKYFEDLLEKLPRLDGMVIYRNDDGTISSRVFFDNTMGEIVFAKDPLIKQ